MNEKELELWFLNNGKYFKTEHLPMIKKLLEELNDSNKFVAMGMNFKDPMLNFIISIFGGQLGIDRFLIGDTGLGIVKLITCGGCGIWTLIDWFLIMNKTKEKNFEKLVKAVRGF